MDDATYPPVSSAARIPMPHQPPPHEMIYFDTPQPSQHLKIATSQPANQTSSTLKIQSLPSSRLGSNPPQQNKPPDEHFRQVLAALFSGIEPDIAVRIVEESVKEEPNLQRSRTLAKSGGHTIELNAVHKFVLAAFCQKIRPNLDSITVLHFDVAGDLDMRANAVKAIMEFLYSGRISVKEDSLVFRNKQVRSKLFHYVFEYIQLLGIYCLEDMRLKEDFLNMANLNDINRELESIHRKYFLHALEQFRDDGYGTDAEIWLAVDGSTDNNQMICKIHSIILQRFCPALYEQMDPATKEIWVEGIPGDGLKYAMDFLYGIITDFKMFTLDEIENMKTTALMLGLDHLAQSITRYLREYCKRTLADARTEEYTESGPELRPKGREILTKTVYSCTICNKTFKHVHNLKTHMKTHLTGHQQYDCNYCPPPGRSFTQKRYLKAHIKQVHPHLTAPGSPQRVFQCPHTQCRKILTTKRNLDDHIKNVHNADRRFKCDECNKTFRYKCDLQRHQREHNGTMFGPCTNCGRYFNHKGNFKRHMREQKNCGKSALKVAQQTAATADFGDSLQTTVKELPKQRGLSHFDSSDAMATDGD